MAKVSLLERQKKSAEAIQTKLAESIQRRYRIDPSAIPWDDDTLSIKKLAENFTHVLEKSPHAPLLESNPESQFGQLLRYGVQNYMFDAYASITDFVYTDLVNTRTSKNRQEWYAPLYGTEVPNDIPLGGKYNDSRLAGLDVEVINKKVGRMLTFERELVDDDQTGQIAQKSSQLGERMRYKEEADVLGVDVFTNVALNRGGITGVAGTSYTTAIGNRPASFAPLSQAGLQTADIDLMNITDPLGNKMMVRPSILLVSPADKFNAAVLLHSALQPSVPNTSTSGSGGTATNFFTGGSTGWTNSINPLQGLYTLKVSRFLPAGYWYLQDPRSVVFQDRDPMELLMEARDAGTSFDRDVYRYRVRRRYQTQVLEYRYIFCGNGQ